MHTKKWDYEVIHWGTVPHYHWSKPSCLWKFTLGNTDDFLYMTFRLAIFHPFPIRCTWSLHFYGFNMQSKHQCRGVISFTSTMAYKSRSPATKKRGLTALNIFVSLGGGRLKPWGIIINCVFNFMCTTKKNPKTDTIYPLPYWISPFPFL